MVVQEKPKGMSMLKNKFAMHFYRAAKPTSPPVQSYGGGDHTAVPGHEQQASLHSHTPPVAASPSTQKVISFNKQRSFGRCDGYVHGPDGGAGDRSVDKKASSYISYVKERRLLEELVAAHGFIDATTNH